MKKLVALLVVLLLLLQYRLWVGQGSFAEVVRLHRAVAAQRAENRDLAQRNAALSAEVSDLRHGLGAVAELARTQLGMIGRGETFYQVVGGAHGDGTAGGTGAPNPAPGPP